MRITYNSKDYTFQVLNTKPLSKEEQEIQILPEGKTTTIVKEKQGWRPKSESDEEHAGLVQAIGKMLSLRYRIWFFACHIIAQSCFEARFSLICFESPKLC